MIMTIAHTGRTGKETTITFDTDRKVWCNTNKPHDVWIYAELTKDVNGVIRDLKNIGYTYIPVEEF